MKQEKTKEARLTETMNLLQQLQTGGVRKNALSFQDLQKKMSEWVEVGGFADYVIPFP
jgi:hypothetical protein